VPSLQRVIIQRTWKFEIMEECPRCGSTSTEFKGRAYGEGLYSCKDCHCTWTQPGEGEE